MGKMKFSIMCVVLVACTTPTTNVYNPPTEANKVDQPTQETAKVAQTSDTGKGDVNVDLFPGVDAKDSGAIIADNDASDTPKDAGVADATTSTDKCEIVPDPQSHCANGLYPYSTVQWHCTTSALTPNDNYGAKHCYSLTTAPTYNWYCCAP